MNRFWVFSALGTLSLAASGGDSPRATPEMIRPRAEGVYNVAQFDSFVFSVRQIGSIAGYEVAELGHPALTTSLGKQMATDGRFIWFLEASEDREVRINPDTLAATR